MNTRKRFIMIAIISLLALTLAACVTPNADRNVALEETGEVYGFWNGVWDSICAPWSFLSNVFFGTDHGLYQSHNNGNWYDFGYVGGLFIIIRLILLPFQFVIFLATH